MAGANKRNPMPQNVIPISHPTTRHYLALGIAAAVVVLAVLSLTLTAWAQEQPTVAPVPLSTRVPATGHTTPGSVHQLSTAPVAPEAQGGTCDVTVTGANNESVHPNSDILVTSANTVTVPDVEQVGGAENLLADGQLVLGETVTVSVRLGADGLFSGGSLVAEFSCTSPPPPTTTTTVSPPTTTTTPPPTVTTAPPKCVDNPKTVENDCVPSLPHTGDSSLRDALFALAGIGVGFVVVKAASKGLAR